MSSYTADSVEKYHSIVPRVAAFTDNELATWGSLRIAFKLKLSIALLEVLGAGSLDCTHCDRVNFLL